MCVHQTVASNRPRDAWAREQTRGLHCPCAQCQPQLIFRNFHSPPRVGSASATATGCLPGTCTRPRCQTTTPTAFVCPPASVPGYGIYTHAYPVDGGRTLYASYYEPSLNRLRTINHCMCCHCIKIEYTHAVSCPVYSLSRIKHHNVGVPCPAFHLLVRFALCSYESPPLANRPSLYQACPTAPYAMDLTARSYRNVIKDVNQSLTRQTPSTRPCITAFRRLRSVHTCHSNPRGVLAMGECNTFPLAAAFPSYS